MFRLRTGGSPDVSRNNSRSERSTSQADYPVSPLLNDFDISDAVRDSGSYRYSHTIKRKDVPSATVRSISNDMVGIAAGHQLNSGIELESLISPSGSSKSPRNIQSEGLVRWGVQWYRQPTYMILFALIGLGLALGHHGYYSSLHGTLAGSDNRQQWAHNFGNIFAILVVTVLHAANGLAYSQYFWVVVTEKTFTIEALDKLFSLTSDPFGFLSLEVLGRAPVATLLAFLTWIMALAGVLPPGTLTVVPGTIFSQSTVSMPSLNWTGPGWVPGGVSDYELNYPLWTKPTPLILGLASRSAQSMDVLPFAIPVLGNASFSLEVRGPYLQCGSPNSTQQAVLEYYQQQLSYGSSLTGSTWRTTNASGSYEVMSDFSAFVPWLGTNGWTSMTKQDILAQTQGPAVDVYNNWDVQIPSDYSIGYSVNFTQIDARQANDNPATSTTASSSKPSTTFTDDAPAVSQVISYQIIPQQLFVQTIDTSIICTLGNGTRDVHFNFTNGLQKVWYGEIKDFDPIFVPQGGELPSEVPFDAHTYMSVFVSLTSMLSGNVTTYLETVKPASVQLLDSSSRILLTGLSACEEFTNNSFTQHPLYTNFSAPFGSPSAQYQEPFTSDIYTKPAWMCRNRTLARAIEDLATNITISMMSQSQLSAPNTVNTLASFYPTRNVYRYNPFYLFLSYGLALLFTLIGIILGLYAFLFNGVIHSTSFSAIVATTRNSALDGLSKGNGLGVGHGHESSRSIKLRFGGLQSEEHKDGVAKRVGFGLAEGVVRLRRGGRYV